MKGFFLLPNLLILHSHSWCFTCLRWSGCDDHFMPTHQSREKRTPLFTRARKRRSGIQNSSSSKTKTAPVFSLFLLLLTHSFHSHSLTLLRSAIKFYSKQNWVRNEKTEDALTLVLAGRQGRAGARREPDHHGHTWTPLWSCDARLALKHHLGAEFPLERREEGDLPEPVTGTSRGCSVRPLCGKPGDGTRCAAGV